MKSKTAVILAGGKGERLKPYTLVMPKPLMPIKEYPVAELIIKKLSKEGFKKIVMAVNYRGDLIKAFFQSGKKWNVKIDYSFETEQLGTAGPLRLLKNKLPNNFLVINGDILSDINLNKLYKMHLKSKQLFTVSIAKRKNLIDYGVIKLNKQKKIVKFIEKPKEDFFVSMGIYFLNKKILKFIPANKKFGFNQLINYFLKKKININTYYHANYWLDIGRPDDYEKALIDFKNYK